MSAEMCTYFGIETNHTTPYRPAANSKWEQLHWTLFTMRRCAVQTRLYDWKRCYRKFYKLTNRRSSWLFVDPIATRAWLRNRNIYQFRYITTEAAERYLKVFNETYWRAGMAVPTKENTCLTDISATKTITTKMLLNSCTVSERFD